jgi:hypothetical protein
MVNVMEAPTIGVYSGEPMVFRNGCWGEDIPEQRKLTSGEFLQLVKTEAGVKQWPEFLTLRVSPLDSIRDQADLMRVDGRRLEAGVAGSRTLWQRRFHRRYLHGMTRETAAGTPLKLEQVSSDIRQSVKHLASAMRREIELESKEASHASTS